MTLRIGVVGFGKMGLVHAGILNALSASSVSSIAEKEGVMTRLARKLLPDLRFYSDVVEMVSQENLDAVYVTTPISYHLSVVEDIASSGKKIGVFVEKPLAGNYGEAERLREIASRHGLLTMLGFQKRFSPIFRKAREMLSGGVIGEVDSFQAYSYVSGVFAEGKGWRFKAAQGGALLDLGPHLIDLLLWFFGEPVQVEGSTRSIYSSEVDDSARGVLTFGSGLVGSFDVSWSAAGYRLPEIGIRVTGSNGALCVTDDYLKIEMFSENLGMKKGKYHFQKPQFESAVDFLVGDPEYCIEDKYFVECILNGRSPEPDFLAGLRVNDVIEKVRNFSGRDGGRQN